MTEIKYYPFSKYGRAYLPSRPSDVAGLRCKSPLWPAKPFSCSDSSKLIRSPNGVDDDDDSPDDLREPTDDDELVGAAGSLPLSSPSEENNVATFFFNGNKKRCLS